MVAVVTAVACDAELFDVFGSAVEEVAVAVAVMTEPPAAVTPTAIVTVAVVPAAIPPNDAVTVPEPPGDGADTVPWLELADVNTDPDGVGNETTTAAAAMGPELCTDTAYTSCAPAAIGSVESVTETARSAEGTTTVVGSDAELLAVFESPAVWTVAVFVTPGTAAPDTATVRERLTAAPEDSAAPRVAVTVWPDVEKLQPSPVPPTKARPAGSSSTTVIGLVVDCEPTFVTFIE